MTVKRSIKRACVGVFAMGAALAVGAAPASAHNLHVDPHGNGGGTHGTVGGEPLPASAKGKGLIPAGPGGTFGLQSPAHDGGLVRACVALDGNDVVTILGPTAPHLTPTCRHGSQ
jgi:hypothetical protein